MSAPVAIADIVVPAGRRALRGVDDLAASIAEIGLLHPITLSADNTLIAGYHRLEACRQLGWAEIPAFRFTSSDIQRRKTELHENYRRNDLTVLERSEVLEELKDIYLVEHPDTKRGVAGGMASQGSTNGTVPFVEKAARDAGVSESTIQKSVLIATKIEPLVRDMIRDLPVATHTRDLLEIARAKPEEQHAIAAVLERGHVESVRDARQVVREESHAERDASFAAPALIETGTYGVLYGDPPWRYEHAKTANRAIENHYPTMELADICALDVASIAAPDCVLFLWATSPKLAEALAVVAAWGFTYRTCAVWTKDRIGMGYYFRQQHELLLVAVKGEPRVPAPEARVSSVINAPRLEHSAKPEIVYDLLERMYPHAARVELFARSGRPGWAAWGFEA